MQALGSRRNPLGTASWSYSETACSDQNPIKSLGPLEASGGSVGSLLDRPTIKPVAVAPGTERSWIGLGVPGTCLGLVRYSCFAIQFAPERG